jgi:NADH kinase
LFFLKWPAPPQNILLVKKDCAPAATESLKEFASYVRLPAEQINYDQIGYSLNLASHLHNAYPATNILLEPQTANQVHEDLPFVAYPGTIDVQSQPDFQGKVDLVVTFGGDGTILHASSLFASSGNVPPMLSFSMGTLGFLGEWKFAEYKRAFREVYMSGAGLEARNGAIHDLMPAVNTADTSTGTTGWSGIRGKSMGSSRAAKVLMRSRLKVSVFAADGTPLSSAGATTSSPTPLHAMNEVIIHRGRDPHLAVVEVYVGGRFLTEAVADGMIVSTPTGSTAYSLSSGGSIVHPLVSSILLTPVCPRSLSFRPLVLPAGTPITLKLSDKNRGRELEVSIDGVRRSEAMGVGMEVRVTGEEVKRTEGSWHGGVPCIMRRGGTTGEGDDGWVGGLNGLLKFNYPFGEES